MTNIPTATQHIPYGSPITVSKGRVSVSTPALMSGVAKRPHVVVGDRGYEEEEPVQVHTDGTIMVELDGGARMVLVRDGRIVE